MFKNKEQRKLAYKENQGYLTHVNFVKPKGLVLFGYVSYTRFKYKCLSLQKK